MKIKQLLLVVLIALLGGVAARGSLTSENLIANPWFADASCRPDNSGWIMASEYPWKMGKPGRKNPGPCGTAIKWHNNTGAPAGVPGTMYTVVTDPFGGNHASVKVQFYFAAVTPQHLYVRLYGSNDGSRWELVETVLDFNGRSMSFYRDGSPFSVTVKTPGFLYYKLEVEDTHYTPMGVPYPRGGGAKVTGFFLWTIQ